MSFLRWPLLGTTDATWASASHCATGTVSHQCPQSHLAVSSAWRERVLIIILWLDLYFPQVFAILDCTSDTACISVNAWCARACASQRLIPFLSLYFCVCIACMYMFMYIGVCV